MNFFRNILSVLLVIAAPMTLAQGYGSTEFHATGNTQAHQVFVEGLLKLHNFEYSDARESFQQAIEIDPDFTMAYWGEALSYEQSFWRRYDTEASRAVLQRLGATPQERLQRAQTEREKDYIRSIEILFGQSSQREREEAYSDSLRELSEKYPEDLDASAFYALSILVTTYGGRDYARYMQAGAITEKILDKDPRHPGALHYNIHSYDDPIHAPLGLRSAEIYSEVAPSAVHALHMGSHIYYALGMWELGIERNTRSFEEEISRQSDLSDPYSGAAYHALTWIPYGYQQMGEFEKAQEYIALIAKQVEHHGEHNPVHRNHYATVRASYLIDSLDWSGELADVSIPHKGLSLYAHVTDIYAKGLVALNRGNLEGARAELEKMNGDMGGMGAMQPMEEMAMTSGRRSELAPHLLRLALEGRIALAEGDADKAIDLVARAEEMEAALAVEYGPAVPVQPMAELLADIYREIGNEQMARQYYEISLSRAVGRYRSLQGLELLSN